MTGKIIRNFLLAACAALTLFLTGCSKDEKITLSISDGWKIMYGDNLSYRSVDYNDSTWKTIDTEGHINVENNQHFFWLRKTVKVPAELKNTNLWLGSGKTNCAFDVYADGIFIGRRGHLPPDVNIKLEQNFDFLIPETCIHDGTVQIALRVYCPGSYVKDIGLSLDNDAMGYFMNSVKNVFNQRIFLCIGVLCFFIMFYAFMQFLMDKKNTTFMYFVGSMFFVVLYFYDLGSENTVTAFNIQRSFTRSCLAISMSFLILFLNKFFSRKHFKLMLGLCIGTMVLFLSLFLAFTGNDGMIDTLFLVSMVPVLITIVYGFMTTIHAIKMKEYDSIPILIGFIAGSICAIHDVAYQAMGKYPFMWIQGFAFFFVDLSVFITLAIRESRIKKEVQRLAVETSGQRDKLSSVIENAMTMAEESNKISESLNQSVDSMINTSTETKNKITAINDAILEQTRIRDETAKAVNNLTSFLTNMSVEFENETSMIEKTATGTQEVIHGIETVGDGISTAAQFTSSLSNLTKAGSDDMKKLMLVMDDIQSSSKEILGVVTTLDNFAQQTDLLSMNASIEAAHSGAAGKGFAVIAHEIKKLAAQTSQWSMKIAEIIHEVIRSIENSVELATKVNKALELIEQGSLQSAEKVNAAWEGMKIQQTAGNEIATESNGLAKSAAHMKKEIESQNEFAGSVMNNMKQLMEASESVNDASKGISSYTEILSKDAQNLAELAERTAQTAHALMNIMKLD